MHGYEVALLDTKLVDMNYLRCEMVNRAEIRDDVLLVGVAPYDWPLKAKRLEAYGSCVDAHLLADLDHSCVQIEHTMP